MKLNTLDQVAFYLVYTGDEDPIRLRLLSKTFIYISWLAGQGKSAAARRRLQNLEHVLTRRLEIALTRVVNPESPIVV